MAPATDTQYRIPTPRLRVPLRAIERSTANLLYLQTLTEIISEKMFSLDDWASNYSLVEPRDRIREIRRICSQVLNLSFMSADLVEKALKDNSSGEEKLVAIISEA